MLYIDKTPAIRLVRPVRLHSFTWRRLIPSLLAPAGLSPTSGTATEIFPLVGRPIRATEPTSPTRWGDQLGRTRKEKTWNRCLVTIMKSDHFMSSFCMSSLETFHHFMNPSTTHHVPMLLYPVSAGLQAWPAKPTQVHQFRSCNQCVIDGNRLNGGWPGRPSDKGSRWSDHTTRRPDNHNNYS